MDSVRAEVYGLTAQSGTANCRAFTLTGSTCLAARLQILHLRITVGYFSLCLEGPQG